MGYYASGSGTIKVKEEPAENTIKIINNAFENVDYYEKEKEINICGYEKYYEESVYDAIEAIRPITISGNIEFKGEDDCIWRFYFKDGNWIEESGEIYYESDLPTVKTDKEEFLGSIIDVIQDQIDNPKGEIITGEWYDDIYDKLKSIMEAWKVF